MFSDAWQRRVEDAMAANERRARLAVVASADEIARVDAFREWVWDHPRRHVLLARLTDRPGADEEE